MRRSLRLGLGALAVILPGATPAYAGTIPIIYNPGHVRVEKVAALPDRPEFALPEGHADLGWAYKDYSVFWMPLGYGRADGFVLTTGDSYYTPKHPGALDAIANSYGAGYHFNPVAHLWGWLILGPLMAMGLLRRLSRRATAPATIPKMGEAIDRSAATIGLSAEEKARAEAAIDRAVAARAAAPVPQASEARTFGRRTAPPPA